MSEATCTAAQKPFYSTGIVITSDQAEAWGNPPLSGKSAVVTTAGVFVPGVTAGLYMAAGHHTARRILADIFPELRDGSEKDACFVQEARQCTI